jgi:hypothetical protein
MEMNVVPTIATVDLDPSYTTELKRWNIAVVPCRDLLEAIAVFDDRRCALLVIQQTSELSLGSIARVVTPEIGHSATLVLSPGGAAFVPGLFVVDATIPPIGLTRLVHRLAGIEQPALHCHCSFGDESTCGIAESPRNCLFAHRSQHGPAAA